MLIVGLLSLYLCLAVEAATNITVGWSAYATDSLLTYYPFVDSNDPSVTWVQNASTVQESAFAFSTNPDSVVAFVFAGNALYYSAPLWSTHTAVLVTIAEYDGTDKNGKIDGVQEFLKIVNLTDASAPIITATFPNNRYLPSQDRQVLYGQALPYGTWNVTVQALNEADWDVTPFNALGSFTYTNLTADEISALNGTAKLSQSTAPPAQTDVNTSGVSLSAQLAASQAQAQKSLTTGVVVGAVIGSIGFVALIGALWYLRIRRLRRVSFVIDHDDEGPSVMKEEKKGGGGPGGWGDLQATPFVMPAPSPPATAMTPGSGVEAPLAPLRAQSPPAKPTTIKMIQRSDTGMSSVSASLA